MSNFLPAKYYIGLSADFHDSAIALVNEHGVIVFAEATERYLQSKRALSSSVDNIFYMKLILEKYPVSDYEVAINWTSYNGLYKYLKQAVVVYSIKNYTKLLKWATSLFNHNDSVYINLLNFMHSSHFGSLTMAGSSLSWALNICYNLPYKTSSYFDHHLCHAFHAFYTAPCDNALVLVLDGAGDEGKGYTIYEGKKQSFTKVFRNKSKASLGNFYGTLTVLCGFFPLAGEQWKVMGMAPYGKKHDAFYTDLKEWIHVSGCNLESNNTTKSLSIREKLKRNEYTDLSRFDIAFTGQLYYEEIIMQLLSSIYQKWPSQNLIITGGCGLNSACNGKIHLNTPFKNIFIPSAPADDGCAVGAALLSFKKHNPDKAIPHGQTNPYLGFAIKDEDILFLVNYSGYTHEKMEYPALYSYIAKEIKEGKLVAWVQGKAEFGPRALGNRSILANPSLQGMKDNINLHVKFREEFRPFAPAIMEEFAADYFENYHPTPYMERVLTIKPDKRHKLSAVNHVDNTGRLQTVTHDMNDHFYNLIREFYKLTDVPVLLNTSFNVMGKPIVNSVQDMAAVFATSGLDILVINQHVFTK